MLTRPNSAKEGMLGRLDFHFGEDSSGGVGGGASSGGNVAEDGTLFGIIRERDVGYDELTISIVGVVFNRDTVNESVHNLSSMVVVKPVDDAEFEHGALGSFLRGSWKAKEFVGPTMAKRWGESISVFDNDGIAEYDVSVALDASDFSENDSGGEARVEDADESFHAAEEVEEAAVF
eukprot:CAMPEP_0172504358 /NCGR_PEP_ID=MMETSP1066-20121228/177975_1 /TAXON_ID=671091 /ORGANISM="Coscinodiscus wailesii, Strain CCMP2513" /LENGTH=176 /DNA_ID=CAMNT_0013280519 /DNA_START=406 /DNA_END=933 /DNA_ORIENTATION=-